MKYKLVDLLLESTKEFGEKELTTSLNNLFNNKLKLSVSLYGNVGKGKIRFYIKNDLPNGVVSKTTNFLSNEGFTVTEVSKEFDDDEDRYYYPYIEFKSKGIEENLSEEDNIRDILQDYGQEHEIDMYLDSLEFTGEVFDTLDDYVEDFQNYLADRSI